jgi:hypothetical protein
MTLLKIHDISAGAITPEQLDAAASKATVNPDSSTGECLDWVMRAVEALHLEGLVKLVSVDDLAQEFSIFTGGNHSFAKKDKFPNVKTSEKCT